MDIGNDVDLSNINITPLWRRRTDTSKILQEGSKPKPRPNSYHVNGIITTDFPVEDKKCSFTLSQPAERLGLASPCAGKNTAVLKHVLHKTSKKTRVARSISISLSKLRSDNRKSDSLDSKEPNGSFTEKKLSNKEVVWPEKSVQDFEKRLFSPLSLNTQKDQTITSPHAPNHHSSDKCELASLSSTSSIPSLMSSTSSDPPTPRSPSPEDRGQPFLKQSQSTSSQSSQNTRHTSSSSSISSLSSSPSPSQSPSPSIVLSTNSAAALKMGTHQLIPKGLASGTKQNKSPYTSGTQGQSLSGFLGLDQSKRSVKALSMVESGSYFSTGGGRGEEGQNESPGMQRRGLRSTSYRKAVVSGVELEAASEDPKALLLSQLDIKVADVQKSVSQTGPTPVSIGSIELPKSAQQGAKSPTSPKNSKPASPARDKLKRDGKNKDLNKEKVLSPQATFDSEEEELYQNYQEKALHNDSDEDAESREAKPDNGIVVQYRPIRTSWSQLSVVKKSGLSDQMTQEERKRQEAIFEVISSEHSYLHSLEILIRMFKNSVELSEAMTKTEHHHLFSNIADVCETSKKFFKELEDRHEQNIVIDDISDIVCKHSQSNFDPYVTYCSNEVYQQRTLQRLLSKNPVFKEVLSRIECHPDCRNLPMISFLILPMQRITRLPLLMDTICQKTPKDSAQYEECTKALQAVSKVVRKCNEGARTMERTEMMYTINSQLDFKIKAFPLVSSSRWMVKRGELTAFVEDNGIFLKRTSRQQVYFFLFNDVLIVTRKKSEESYSVIDYALRDEIWVGSCQPEDLNLSPVRTTTSILSSRQPGANHLFRLCFRSNRSGEKVPMILSTELLNERARWISALGHNDNNNQSLDRANAMQVEVIRTYTSKQPDELSLQVADVVLISQMVDGWYQGERLRDGERGWFLTECAEPITCQATIERNRQRMDRLQGLETNV
ncbi:rho guanine nucleotide exchange factor 26-like [Gouania willdenowi]|uniref:Rho guanine nucleotide exchange factor 26 n=1 Tax=Gouania willdenowi TaxID=441366 RepID=A0A8C5I0A7_GOUWI|nr:rho guanine nucleotide exchange factor 26 [Gouania willdenowi]